MSTQAGDEMITSYMVALSKELNKIEKRVVGTRSRGLDGPVHNIQPGDYVSIRSFAKRTLEPQWEGSFQVLLTSRKYSKESLPCHDADCKPNKETGGVGEQYLFAAT